MTREEAIEILQKIKPIPHRGDGKSTTHILETIALDMAIKALEQQPCEDCISRQEALSHKHIVYDDDGIGYSVVRVDEIMAMPSVTPKVSEDCISREAVDEYITILLSGYLYDEERTRLEDLSAFVWELPSVQPTRPTGK